MWVLYAFLSAFLLGCYEVNKKMSLNGNAVIPVLFFNTLFSSLIFLPFIVLSYTTDVLDGSLQGRDSPFLVDLRLFCPEASATDLVRTNQGDAAGADTGGRAGDLR